MLLFKDKRNWQFLHDKMVNNMKKGDAEARLGVGDPYEQLTTTHKHVSCLGALWRFDKSKRLKQTNKTVHRSG